MRDHNVKLSWNKWSENKSHMACAQSSQTPALSIYFNSEDWSARCSGWFVYFLFECPTSSFLPAGSNNAGNIQSNFIFTNCHSLWEK